MSSPTPYRHDEHPALVMPIGGVGTGTVGLAADGSLRQWQLMNVGTHHGELPGSCLAIRVQQHVPPLDRTCLLAAPPVSAPPTPMVDDGVVPAWWAQAVDRHGCLDAATFTGTYPIGRVDFESDLPVSVALEAMSPMQPWDVATSSTPAALFEVTLTNETDVPTRVWLGFGGHNSVGLDPRVDPVGVCAPGYGGNVNTFRRFRDDPQAGYLVMGSVDLAADDPSAGELVLSMAGAHVGALPQFTDVSELLAHLRGLPVWGDRGSPGAVPGVEHARPAPRAGASPRGRTWLGALTGRVDLGPGETRVVRAALSWHFPNRYVDFPQFGPQRPEWGLSRFWLGTEYATRFDDGLDVARSVLRRWDDLWRTTRAWTRTLDALPLPRPLIEDLAAQAVVPRSPTLFRGQDGTVYAFEGVLGASTRMWAGDVGGSCPLNCTHVWNYAQAMAALFPSLEADMRATEFDVMQAPDGSLPHRLVVPTYLRQLWDGPIGGPDAPALDGMLGAVLKTYRELRRGAIDLDWVDRRQSGLDRLLAHIATTWDPDDTGLLTGVQPSTHDIHLHGANPYMGTLWLAALRAGEEVARLLGDTDGADARRERFERASTALDERLFTGEYYFQVPDHGLPERHQWGRGCLTDQLIGQWWAHELGLGHLMPADHVRSALRAVVAHNLRDDAGTRGSGQRRFALDGERGLVLCTWPHGGRPQEPTEYCDEVWSGSEYQVAAHCLREGLADEANAVLSAVRARHDGRRRNPFNHVECGDHYARSMSGWSVLEASLGLSWSAMTGALAVDAVPEGSAVPVLTGTGWGALSRERGRVTLRCHAGRLPVRTVQIGGHRCTVPGDVPAGSALDLEVPPHRT